MHQADIADVPTGQINTSSQSHGLDVLNEMIEQAERDESFQRDDDTHETLRIMRQENVHSLERDLHDSFFWIESRPDAAAGMAKTYLKARCPTPYWRLMVASNSYGLWGALAMSRARARLEGHDCGLPDLEACSRLNLNGQIELMSKWKASSPQESSDFERAEGLPLPGIFLADVHKHAALRALLAAVMLGRHIDWPDLPKRLQQSDPAPEKLPALLIDLDSLKSREMEVDLSHATSLWTQATALDAREALMVPDWASWMLYNPKGIIFEKISTTS
jgi:hypothetical protein